MHKCPICGKNKKEFIDDICSECYAKKNSLIESFKDVKIEYCSICNRYKHKGTFSKKDIKQIVKSFINFSKDAKISSFEVNLEEKEITIKVKGNFKGYKKSEEYVIPYINQSLTCKSCGKQGSQYFEGILQIRGKKIMEVVNKYILDQIKNKKNVFCNKMVETKHGIDYFLTDKNYIQELARKIHNEFGIELKVNAQLFSRNKQTSKDLFRVNALVKLPEFIKGDILKIDEKLIMVESIKGKTIIGKDIETKKKYKSNVKEYKTNSYETFNTEVIQDKPKVMILHPKTYQPVELNIKGKTGDKIKVILINNKLFIDPNR